MQEGQAADQGSMGMVRGALGGPLKPGEIGVLMARAGVGKTACLTHIALERLLRGHAVLHVAINNMPDKIKAWYHEFLKFAAEELREDMPKLQYRVEPLRFILAYLHNSFSTYKLAQSLQNLKEQAKFTPSMAVLDGLDFDRTSRSTIEELREIAQRYELSLWMSAKTHQHISTVNERGIPYPCHEADDLFDSIVLLEPVSSSIRVKTLKHNNVYQPESSMVRLNPQTFLIEKE